MVQILTTQRYITLFYRHIDLMYAVISNSRNLVKNYVIDTQI